MKWSSQHIRPVIGSSILLCVGIGAFFIYSILRESPQTLDKPILQAFANAANIHAYSQYVETQAQFPDRELDIIGTYNNDDSSGTYASYSTTTLLIRHDAVAHVFTHQNIAIGAEIYVKIQTTDRMLKSVIKSSPQWRYFKANNIPPTFAGVAVPGPIQDNLRVLDANGKYISLVKNYGLQPWGAESLYHYAFKRSDQKPDTASSLSAVLDRIGPDGVIDVWVDSQTFEPRYLRFVSNAYISTTTLLQFNTSPLIVAPIATSTK